MKPWQIAFLESLPYKRDSMCTTSFLPKEKNTSMVFLPFGFESWRIESKYMVHH